jgi:hypothetical protein
MINKLKPFAVAALSSAPEIAGGDTGATGAVADRQLRLLSANLQSDVTAVSGVSANQQTEAASVLLLICQHKPGFHRI